LRGSIIWNVNSGEKGEQIRARVTLSIGSFEEGLSLQ
jgi:hypothetical protein